MGDALKRVVSRAISDAAFRRHLQTDPRAALKEFDLSTAEIAAITSGDPAKLTALGIDQRMSRMFAVTDGGVGLGANARVDSGDSWMSSARIDAEAGGSAAGQLDRVDVAGAGVGGLGRIDPETSGSNLDRIDDAAAGTGDGPHLVERLDTEAGGDSVDVHDVSGGLPQGGAETPNEI